MGRATVKCHLGRCTARHEDDYPPWESIKIAPIWEEAEWSSFRSIVGRLMPEPKFEASDEAVDTMHVEGHISRDGELIEGPQVIFVQMVKRALPRAFMNRRFQMVCFVIGHIIVSVVRISIVYKINEPWLIPALAG